MNILITGATGFVGRHLMADLKRRANLFILARPGSNYASVEADGVFIFEDNIPDLADYLRRNHMDGVIHLASLYVAAHTSEQIKELVLSNIYLGTALLEACKDAGVKWFLNTGTIWQNYHAQDRSDAYNPVNLYAASKQAFMTMARYYEETGSIRFCTLKLCDTYGPDDTRRKIFALFEQIAKTGEALDMSPGEQLLDMIHIDDVVAGFERLVDMLDNPACKLLPEYVLSSGKQRSLKELAALYEQKHQVKLNIRWGGRAYREREVMKPYKGNVLEGWSPKVVF
nr:NAD(P)-dependent oxidoreductase [Rikenellaceae bacterium]